VALAAVLITIVYVWHAQRPAVLEQVTWDDVIAEAETGGYRIIITEALAKLYDPSGSDPLLIDTRQEWEYRTGHIKGALNFSMDPMVGARQKADDLAAFLGPDKERTLVFY
jgi:predicted sulfurtransferase